MRFELARDADDAEIRRLLRESPLDGPVRITLECEPDSALAAGVQGDVHQVVAVREQPGGSLAGMGARTVLEAWVNGAPVRLAYLSQLRADRRHRGSVRAIAGAYEWLRRQRTDGETPFCLTTVVEDSRAARRLLEAGLRGMPRYRPAGRLVTLALRAHRRARAAQAPDIAIESATAGDAPAVVACLERYGRRHQFAPRWTLDTLRCPRRARGLRLEDFIVARRGGTIAGCAALWDQRAFKQAVVRDYAPALRLLRPVVNAAAPWLGTVHLPPPGRALQSVFLSHLAADGDDPALMRGMVAAGLRLAARRGASAIVLGLAADHPALRTVETAFPGRRYTSIVYVVYWEDGAEAVERLDGRVPQPEVAIL
jgi:hypothetical protein